MNEIYSVAKVPALAGVVHGVDTSHYLCTLSTPLFSPRKSAHAAGTELPAGCIVDLASTTTPMLPTKQEQLRKPRLDLWTVD
jgi:hypothetical protein